MARSTDPHLGKNDLAAAFRHDCDRQLRVNLGPRAESKFVLLVSDSLLQHLPYDRDVAEQAAALQLFVRQYCTPSAEVALPYYEGVDLR